MRRILGFLAVFAAFAAPASADVKGVFKEAWTCAKSVPHSAYTIAKDIKDKGEAVASMSASIGVCTAETGGQPQMLAFTTGVLTMIKASKPDMLPTNQCKSRIHTQMAKPFALGVAGILPNSGAKTKLLSLVEREETSDWIWDTLATAPTPFGTIPRQVDCACDLIDNGLTLADVSAVSNVIKNTSKACAGILDEAGLGFINKWGSAGIAWGKGKYQKLDQGFQALQGKKTALPDEAIQRAYFGVYLKELAENQAAAMLNVFNGDGTAEGAWATSDVDGGWAVESVGYCTHPMTFANVCMIKIADMTNKCKFYYSTTINGGGNVAKCDQWRQDAVAQVTKDANNLVTQANSMTVFRLKLYGHMEKEWLWRLPPCHNYHPNNVLPKNTQNDGNSCDLTAAMNGDIWKLGTYKDNKNEPWNYTATGAYAQARDALVQANYNSDLAHKAVLAGLYAPTQATTLAAWNTPFARDNVRYRWLPKWMPSQPMLGPYGCKGGGKWGPECAAQTEKAFDMVCHGAIRDAFVKSLNVLGVAFKFGEARNNCQLAMRAVVGNATSLQDAGFTEVAAKANAMCPSPTMDRMKSATCRQNLDDIWFSCARPNIHNIFGAALGDTKTCFNNRTLKFMEFKPITPPPMIKIPPGGFRAPRGN